jgi:NitT/TauT family transport system permease protein
MNNTRARFLTFYRALPLVVFLAAWEFAVRRNPGLKFFFGSPMDIFRDIYARSLDGSLLKDVAVTFVEASLGFLLGNLVGTIVGLALWYSRFAMDVAKPYVVALGSAPIFAFAPLLIIWFGTGLYSKVMIASLSTVFVALVQSYTGASEVSNDQLRLMQTFGATRMQTFRKVVAPSSIVWVISAFRLNVGFALLGAFIGEFISSNQGLGHLILVATGLFDISLVLSGVFLLCALAFVLNFLVARSEPILRQLVVRYL